MPKHKPAKIKSCRKAFKKRFKKCSKKGFELSITFLVILIISIVIFSSGIFLIRKFFSITEQVQERITEQTKREIERRLIEGGEKMSIPNNRMQVKVGEPATFGLGILNTIGKENTFAVEMSFNRAFTVKEQEEIFPEQAFINSDWMFSELQSQKLKRNEHVIIPLTIKPTGQMTSGTGALSTRKDTTYIFNVCVYKDNADLQRAHVCQKLKPTATELELLHGGQVKKIYVEVV